MITKEFLIKKDMLPNWFAYPDSYLKIVELNLTNLSPWHILSDDLLKKKYEGLKIRYPKTSLIPFARRFDNDDVACWEQTNPQKIVIIHDFASEGWEKREYYENFWDWFKVTIDAMIEFE